MSFAWSAQSPCSLLRPEQVLGIKTIQFIPLTTLSYLKIQVWVGPWADGLLH